MKKAFDKVPRKDMWALHNKGVHVAYGRAKTSIAIFNQAVKDFPINI